MKVQGFNYRLRILLPVVAMLLLCAPAQGQSKKQLERDKARIEKEIARLTGELGKARKNTRNSTKQIKLINQRIDERTRLIKNINSQMTLLDRQITRTEDSLRVVRGQIDSMKMEYAKVVRTLYGLRGNVSSTSMMLDNETYNYSYLKMKYFKEYSRYRKHQAAVIQRREQLFQNLDLDLQRQRNEKVTLLAQERKQKDALAREQQKHQKNLDKSQQDERYLQQQISKKEQQRSRLQKQIQQLISNEVAKAAPKGSGSASGKGSGTKTPSPAYSDAASADFVQNRGRMATTKAWRANSAYITTPPAGRDAATAYTSTAPPAPPSTLWQAAPWRGSSPTPTELWACSSVTGHTSPSMPAWATSPCRRGAKCRHAKPSAPWQWAATPRRNSSSSCGVAPIHPRPSIPATG